MAEEGEWECPNCHAPVQEDWRACPACGAEFAPPEEEVPELRAAPEEAPAAGPEPEGAPEAERPEADELAELAASVEAEAVAGAAKEEGPEPARTRAPEAAKKAAAKRSPPREERPARAGSVAKLGGLVGATGVAVLVLGLLGVLFALNYDTWVRGAATNTVGPTQSLGAAGMGILMLAGLALFLLAFMKAKRRAVST